MDMDRKGSFAGDRPVAVVHLRRAEISDPAIRAEWQARGYATLGPVEGHDPHQLCPICSTGEPPPEKPGCSICGQGPCRLADLIRGLRE
jgi:hypothetical protein